MKKLCIVPLLLLCLSTGVFGQVWNEGFDGGAEFNCELIKALLDEYGDEPYARVGDEVQTFEEYHVEVLPDCFSTQAVRRSDTNTLFKITVKSSVNVRDCGGTDCELVGKAQPGEIYEVIAEDGDWFEIRIETGTAFIAGWLTSRLPDSLVETGEPLYVFAASCVVVPDLSRSSSMDISVILTGDRKNEIQVDVYRPDNDKPLPVNRQLDKTFIDTGGSYILQTYHWNTWWPTGLYTVDVQLGRQFEKIAWNVTERGDYNFFVSCD